MLRFFNSWCLEIRDVVLCSTWQVFMQYIVVNIDIFEAKKFVGTVIHDLMPQF